MISPTTLLSNGRKAEPDICGKSQSIWNSQTVVFHGQASLRNDRREME